MTTFEKLLQAACNAPRRPLPAPTDALLEARVADFLEGDWTPQDVVEVFMDETSTAAAVGDGTARPLGSYPEEDEEKEKATAVERFLQHCGEGPHSPSQIHRYMMELAPGISESWITGLVRTLKEKGYVI